MLNGRIQILLGTACLLAGVATYGVRETLSLAELLSDSGAICQATALGHHAFRKPDSGGIHTASGYRVETVYKGSFSPTVNLVQRGGELDGTGETSCGFVVLPRGTRCLLFIRMRDDGSLYSSDRILESDARYQDALTYLENQPAEAEGLDVSAHPVEEQEALDEGLAPGSTGYSSRFLQGDRGEPIAYVVDMDFLPSGISSNQAMTALGNAFAAWSEATSLTFRFGGIESFGMAAPNLGILDGRLYIQLHDAYNYIPASSTLGKGGRSYSFNPGTWPEGGLGGKVGSHEFDLSTSGYLVIEHSKTSLSNPVNFEEVLCHEIGHILSLIHSSEDSNETDNTLLDAMMYYQAHFDGRGASLRQWDTNVVAEAYPQGNTPPYGYDRVIEAVTQPVPPDLDSGVNQVRVQAFDLQDSAWPVLLNDNSFEANGTFLLTNGNIVFFTPGGYYPDSEGFFSYAHRYLRMSDGVNLSPPIQVRVISFNADSNGDYLQDSWASFYSVSGKDNDPDIDGLTNYEEWLLEFDPTDSESSLVLSIEGDQISWSSKSNELYQLLSSTSLTNEFVADGNPILAGSTNETALIGADSVRFYRIQRKE